MRNLFFLAGRADTEEFDLVGGHLEARCSGHFGRELVQQADIGIDDAMALGTNQVRVGVRLLAVVAFASIGIADFQNLADILQQVDGLVDRGKARSREIYFDLVISLFHARVLVGVEKSLQDGDPLRRDPEFSLPKPAEDVIQALLRVFHLSTMT